MKIQIEIHWPRWLAEGPRWRARVVLALVLVLVAAVPLAWANDRFADVPTSSPHHNDISAIATAGITRGCNPPANTLYCPADPVRRDQMASFLQRGLGRASRSAVVVAYVPLAPSMAAVNSTTLTVPGSGFVLVTATGTPNIGYYGGCPCKVAIRVSDPVSGEFSQEQVDTVAYGPGGIEDGAMAVTWLFPVTVTGPTSRTFNLDARHYSGTGETYLPSMMTALWVPFGSSGSNSLGASEGVAGRNGH